MIKLQSFEYRGPATLYVTNTLPIEGGSVMFHRPFVSLGGELAITPVLTVEGMAVAMRLDQWQPMWLSYDAEVAILPLMCPSQEHAATAAQAFDSDPNTHWRAGNNAIDAWCEQYIANLQAREAVGQTTPR